MIRFFHVPLAVLAVFAMNSARAQDESVRQQIHDMRRQLLEAARAQAKSLPKQALDQLYFQLAGSLGQTSFIGVGLADIDNERASALKLRDVHGVEITRVEDNSPAAKAGLKVGDVVLEYNGQRVEGMEQFGRFVRETPVGREVKLLVSRDGQQQTIPVAIGVRHDMLRSGDWNVNPGDMRQFQFNMPEMIMPEMPQVFVNARNGILGVEAESLNSQLAEFFGVKEGVLVRSVVKDSAAAKAGIKAGDVITKIDGEAVASPADLSNAIRAARTKGAIPLQIVRDRKEMTLSVTVEKAKTEQPPAPRTRTVSARPVRM